jgi:hypothetical protein
MIRVDPSARGCGVGRSHPPIIAETWNSGGPPPATVGYALTTSRVLSVSLDKETPIATRVEATLPDGLRAVVMEIRGKELLSEDQSLPRFTPLDADGEPITESADSSYLHGPLMLAVPTANVDDPADPTFGPCRISGSHLHGLTPTGGSIVTQVRSYSGLIGQGFISCASTSYSLDGWPLLAGILLSASHPGSAPPALPAMTPLSGHPGVFRAPGPEGSSLEDQMLARRVPGGWLVVARAKLPQRLALLEHLRATVHV